MKTVDLVNEPSSVEDLFLLAEDQGVLVRTPAGKLFAITEIEEGDDAGDDFAIEVALTRQNRALRELLAERAKEPGNYTINQVRQRLGIPTSE